MNNTTTIRKLSHKNKHTSSSSSLRQLLILLVVFLTGCFFSSTILLHYVIRNQDNNTSNGKNIQSNLPPAFENDQNDLSSSSSKLRPTSFLSSSPSSSTSIGGKRILIALASFDFSQFPLLEEVLDSYQDLCFAGAKKVDIYIYTTVPYTVALIDLLNTRLDCQGLQIYIVVKTPAVRLNLVDFHRTLFYENIDEYDLFIYSEVRVYF